MSPAIKKNSKYLLRSQSAKALIPSKEKSAMPVNLSVSRVPTPAYLESVDLPKSQTITLSQTTHRRKHLLILDLNGTLVSRTKKRNAMFVRPHIDTFLDYIFDQYKVMVWSSAQQTSVHHMLLLFGKEYRKKIFKVWNRTNFGLSEADIHKKAPTIKDLARVWQRFPKYNAHSTVILDDSPSKSVLQPFNSIHLKTFDHGSDSFWTDGDQELLSVMEYLKLLHLQTNIPNFMRNTPFASPLKTLDTDLEKENKMCYYYGFHDQTVERWDFSKNETKVEKLNHGSDDDTTDSEATN